MDGQEVLTLAETGDFLHISKSTVRRLIGRGDLPAKKAGGVWRLLKSDIVSFMRDYSNTTDQGFEERPGRPRKYAAPMEKTGN